MLATTGFGAAQAAHRVGWVWADQPSAASYTPDTSYSFNSSGGAVQITRSSAGVYNVTFSGLGSSGAQKSNVLVSGYSTNGTCKVQGWSFSSASISVLCFDTAGNPADSSYTLLYQAHSGTFGSAAKGMGFVWADQPSAASYTPSPTYQYNSTGGTNTITRSGVGSYSVLVPGLTKLGGHVQVTAYGGDAARCKVSGWSQSSEGSFVGVLCFDHSGAASDQAFTMAYARGVPIAYLGATTTGLYGWFNKAKGSNYPLFKAYRFNNMTGGVLTGNRSARGVTSVTWAGSASYTTSDMLVTAYGSDNSYCNVSGWTPLDTVCYANNGNLRDSRYDVAFSVATP